MYVCRQIDKSPFDNIQSDVRHEAEGGICYQLFPPIQTQGFQNKHNQNMSVYICAGFWGLNLSVLPKNLIFITTESSNWPDLAKFGFGFVFSGFDSSLSTCPFVTQ